MIELQAEHREQAGQRRDEARHAEAVEQQGIERADEAADGEAARMASATGQPWLTHSTPTIAEAKPLTEPTDRSISPTISMQTMPSAMTPTVEQSNSRLTRLLGDRNTGLRPGTPSR